MASDPKKMSEMDRVTQVTRDIIVLVVVDPDGDTPTNKVMDLQTFLANLPCPVVCKGTFATQANSSIGGNKMDVAANTTFTGTLRIPRWTPTSSSESCPQGKTGADDTYLYHAIQANTIRRLPWQSF